MFKECDCCKSKTVCNTAVEPGSIMCQLNRLRADQTKAELLYEELKHERKCEPIRRCPYCGNLLN